MKVLLLKESDIEDLISLEETIEAVEMAFRDKGNNRSQMPPKSYVYFNSFDGDFRTMPAYLEDMGAAGVKVVNVHPENPEKHEIPSVMATIVLLSPETGKPLAIMAGTKITGYRTGGAGGVAAKHLARKNSEIVGMIGTGVQARTQLLALDEIFDLNRVKAYDLSKENRTKYSERMGSELDAEVEAVDEERKAVESVDIIVTTTPSRSPILKDEWIPEEAHINAIGADAEGKQELDPRILKRGKIVVDDWEQASHSGEISVSITNGELEKHDIYGQIGEVVAGKKIGRESEDEITIFDSTGLAVQDIATAWKVYERAREQDIGHSINLLDFAKE